MCIGEDDAKRLDWTRCAREIECGRDARGPSEELGRWHARCEDANELSRTGNPGDDLTYEKGNAGNRPVAARGIFNSRRHRPNSAE